MPFASQSASKNKCSRRQCKDSCSVRTLVTDQFEDTYIYENEHAHARVFRHMCMSMSRTHMNAGHMAWLLRRRMQNRPHLPVSAHTRTSMRDVEWTRKSSKRGNTCNTCESRHLAIHEAVVEGLNRVVQGMLGVFLGDHERSILPYRRFLRHYLYICTSEKVS